MKNPFIRQYSKTALLISLGFASNFSLAQAQGMDTRFIPGIYADSGNGAYFSLYSQADQFWIEYTPHYDVLSRTTYLLKQISGHFEAQGLDCAGQPVRLSLLFQNGNLWLSTDKRGGRIIPQISPTPWILHTSCK